MDKVRKQFRFTIVVVTPMEDVPFSVSHISESKISAHFPHWFSKQLGNTYSHYGPTITTGPQTDSSGTLPCFYQKSSLCSMGQLVVS